MISIIKIFGVKTAMISIIVVSVMVTFLLTSVVYYGIFGEPRMQEVLVSMIIPVFIIFLLVPKIVDLQSIIYKERKKNDAIINLDLLTGLHNRKSLLEHLRREINFAKRYNSFLTIMSIEVGNYAQIEKKRGRHAVDYVIKELSNAIAQNFRKTDIIGRYKDDTFMIILTHTTLERSAVIKEKLEQLINKRPIYFKQEIDIDANIKSEALSGDEKESEDTLLNRLEKVA